MRKLYLAAGAVALAGAAAYLWWEQKRAAEEMPQAAQAPLTTEGAPISPQQAAQLAKQFGKAGATVLAGAQVANAIGDVAQLVGGEGAGDTARVVQASAGVGLIVGKGTQAVLEKAGVGSGAAKYGGIAAGVGVVFGAPVVVGALSLQAGGDLAQALGNLVIGKDATKTISGAVSQFDPTKPGSAANKVVGGFAGAVKKLKFW